MTELYNARFLLQATDREVQRASRYDTELCVLFLDLDRFKIVNDRHGHLVGSQVLRAPLARCSQTCIRRSTRWRATAATSSRSCWSTPVSRAALQVGERIRRRSPTPPSRRAPRPPIRLTISIGVAAYPLHGATREQLLDAADKAMYRAKSRGRNCVCSADELSQPRRP